MSSEYDSSTRKIDFPSRDYIAQQWDEIAEYRFRQINEGKDISYSQILLPSIEERVRTASDRYILDAGCGLGFTSKFVANKNNRIDAVDLSIKSIEIAKRHVVAPNVNFFHNSIEDHISKYAQKYDLVMLNMVLMDAPDLEKMLRLLSRCIGASGHLIATICHPCFWPSYWGYERKPWFAYGSEITIESPFRISGDETLDYRTIHIHRPLEFYIRKFSISGFYIKELAELHPERTYGHFYKKPFRYPRFIIFDCEV